MQISRLQIKDRERKRAMIKKAFIFSGILLYGCANHPSVPDDISQEDINQLDMNALCDTINDDLGDYSAESQARLLAEISRRGLECTPAGKLRYLLRSYDTAELCVQEIISTVETPASVPYIQEELKRRSAVCDPQKTQMAIQVYIAKQRDETLYNALRAASTASCHTTYSGSQSLTTCF